MFDAQFSCECALESNLVCIDAVRLYCVLKFEFVLGLLRTASSWTRYLYGVSIGENPMALKRLKYHDLLYTIHCSTVITIGTLMDWHCSRCQPVLSARAAVPDCRLPLALAVGWSFELRPAGRHQPSRQELTGNGRQLKCKSVVVVLSAAACRDVTEDTAALHSSI
jgi:hypothetical protein